MKEDFISDKRRVSYLSATYSRIYRGQSVLIILVPKNGTVC